MGGHVDELEEDVGWSISCLESVIDVEESKLEEELFDNPGTTIGTKFSAVSEYRFLWDVVFDHWSTRMSIRVHRKASPAKELLAYPRGVSLSRFFQFFDINCGLFTRLHFSIGCYDYRRTTRLRQSIHFSKFKSFLLIMCIDAPESTTNSLSSGLMVDAGRHQFSEGEKNAFYFSPLVLGCCWPASTLLHGHIALATLSLPETDPQILEHWGYADEVHLGKSFQAKDSGLKCKHDVTRL